MNNADKARRFDAIGFDLFNTLVVANEGTLDEAMNALIQKLRQSGIEIDEKSFNEHYGTAAAWHIQRSRESGVETHNRFWICDTLNRLGNRLSPDDPRITSGVEAYFSAFYGNIRLVPQTLEMLEELQGKFSLGLLSNFTHGPAARKLLGVLGIESYFTAIVISGEAGFRKPHPHVFDILVEGLAVARDRILFVGDDPEADVRGALGSGLYPVWMTYARDGNLPFTSEIFSEKSDDPKADIPRIDTWNKLMPLLGAYLSPEDPPC